MRRVIRVMPGVVRGMILGGSGRMMRRSAEQGSRGKGLGRQGHGQKPNERYFEGSLHASESVPYGVTLAHRQRRFHWCRRESGAVHYRSRHSIAARSSSSSLCVASIRARLNSLRERSGTIRYSPFLQMTG